MEIGVEERKNARIEAFGVVQRHRGHISNIYTSA